MQETYSTDLNERSLVRDAMLRDVRAPLAALRTTIEFMQRDLVQGDPHEPMMTSALEEIDRLQRNVETLYQFSVAPDVAPLTCTLEEICRASIRLLAPDETERVWLALDQVGATLQTDGTLLANALALFIDDAIRRGSAEILFHAHVDDGVVYFAIVDDFSSTDEIDVDALPTESEPASMGLRVARRDVGLLGGSITSTRSNVNQNCVIVSFGQPEEQS